MTVATNFKQLYEIDNHRWLLETIELLKQKQFHELDLENLIEELEDLGSERKNKVRSLLEQIIRHLLLLNYWEQEYDRNCHHWSAEIIGFRTQLRNRMTTNFRNYLTTELEQIYHDALKYVQKKSNLNILPQECPYTLDQLLDEDWFPPR